MNKLTDLETVQVFRHYGKCPVKCYDGKKKVSETIRGVIFENPTVFCEKDAWDPCDVKLVLKQLKYITDNEIREACRLFDNSGFMFAAQLQIIPKKDDPTIKRLVCDCGDFAYAYHFDITNGNIALFKNGIAITYTNKQTQLIQWYFKNFYAIPLHFDGGHWANGKTAIDLGIGVPDRQVLHNLLNEKFEMDKTEIGNWWLEHEKFNFDDPKILDEMIVNLKYGVCDK